MLVKNFPNYINKSWKASLGRSLHCFSNLVETSELNVLFVMGSTLSRKRDLIVSGMIYPMRKECYFILLSEVASWQLESIEPRLIVSQSATLEVKVKGVKKCF